MYSNKNSKDYLKLLSYLFLTQNKEDISSLISANNIQFLKTHGLAALFFSKLQSEDEVRTDSDGYNILKDSYYSNLNHNMILWTEFKNIASTFDNNGLDHIPIKGIDMLARFYPSFHIRSNADIDLLIHKYDIKKVCELLFQLGYKKDLEGFNESYFIEKQYHLKFIRIFKEIIISIEIHWDLDYPYQKNKYLTKIWSRATHKTIDRISIKLISSEDVLLCNSLHDRRFGNILSLKRAWYINEIIEANHDLDWSYIYNEAKNRHILMALFFILQKANLISDHDAFDNLNNFRINTYKINKLKRLISKYIFNLVTSESIKKTYLAFYFSIYDNFWDSLIRIKNMPYEQTCKYYGINPKNKRLKYLYNFWPFSLPVYFLSKK